MLNYRLNRRAPTWHAMAAIVVAVTANRRWASGPL